MATVRDMLIADAKSLPDLIAKAAAADPALAKQLTAKPLVASKSVWGSAIALVVSWCVTRYGLGWDDGTSALVTGLIDMAVTAAVRVVTSQPINGIVKGTAP
jgi:hypothetical protein